MSHRNFACFAPWAPAATTQGETASDHAITLPVVEEVDSGRARAAEGVGRSRLAAGRDRRRAWSRRGGGEGARLAARHRAAPRHAEARTIRSPMTYRADGITLAPASLGTSANR